MCSPPRASPSRATTKGRSSRTRRASPRSRAAPRLHTSGIRTATPSRSLKRRVPECAQRPSAACETAYLANALERSRKFGYARNLGLHPLNPLCPPLRGPERVGVFAGVAPHNAVFGLNDGREVKHLGPP